MATEASPYEPWFEDLGAAPEEVVEADEAEEEDEDDEEEDEEEDDEDDSDTVELDDLVLVSWFPVAPIDLARLGESSLIGGVGIP